MQSTRHSKNEHSAHEYTCRYSKKKSSLSFLATTTKIYIIQLKDNNLNLHRIAQQWSKDAFWIQSNGHYLRISQPLVYFLLELTLFALSPIEQKPTTQNAYTLYYNKCWEDGKNVRIKCAIACQSRRMNRHTMNDRTNEKLVNRHFSNLISSLCEDFTVGLVCVCVCIDFPLYHSHLISNSIWELMHAKC